MSIPHDSSMPRKHKMSFGTKILIIGLTMLVGGISVIGVDLASSPSYSFESDSMNYSENIHQTKKNFRILIWSYETVVPEFEIFPTDILISIFVEDENQISIWEQTFSGSIKDSFTVEPGKKYSVTIENLGSEYITLKGKFSDGKNWEVNPRFIILIVAIVGFFVIIVGLIMRRLEKPIGTESARTWHTFPLRKKFFVGLGASASMILLIVIAGGSAYLTNPTTCFGEEITIMGTEEPDYIEGTPGNDVIYGDKGGDIIYGLGGDDKICGSNGDDYIIGGLGNDKIDSSLGNDILEGNEGDDVLDGYGGNDIMDGGAGIDQCIDGGVYKNCES